ncbi:MAG: hypothetical protein P1P90_04890 [Patescibacteria group bacterium]|nr:hypothetical protein [Patescibacteria group bacterium]
MSKKFADCIVDVILEDGVEIERAAKSDDVYEQIEAIEKLIDALEDYREALYAISEGRCKTCDADDCPFRNDQDAGAVDCETQEKVLLN